MSWNTILWGNFISIVFTIIESPEKCLVLSVQNLKGYSKNDQICIQINHCPYKLKSKIVLPDTHVSFQSAFLLPIADPFFKIEFQIIVIKKTGWISDNVTKEVLGTANLYVADLMSKLVDYPVKVLNIKSYIKIN